jgi:hypothetical protein
MTNYLGNGSVMPFFFKYFSTAGACFLFTTYSLGITITGASLLLSVIFGPVRGPLYFCMMPDSITGTGTTKLPYSSKLEIVSASLCSIFGWSRISPPWLRFRGLRFNICITCPFSDRYHILFGHDFLFVYLQLHQGLISLLLK